jgi:hypothetical protein
MLLILSARTVGEDIAGQFGRLPPSFLPMGSKRLFTLQAEAARGEPCFMTLPEDIELPAADLRAIEAAGISVIRQSQRLPLTRAIGEALIQARAQGPVRVLYGDTMVRMPAGAEAAPDMVALQDTTANYPWAFLAPGEGPGARFSDAPPRRLDSRRVVCGYYHFSDPDLLAAACHEPSIVGALNHYDARRPLTCIEAEAWYDFGHLPLYYRSKKDMLVKRVFNELEHEGDLLIKRSADTLKMRAEANWYESLPAALRLNTPRYGGRVERDHRAGYALEYLYQPLLADLSVFGALPLASWLEIIQACIDFVNRAHAIRPPEGSPEASPEFAARFFQSVIVDKTWSRLEAWCASPSGACSMDDRITLDGVEHPPLRVAAAALIARIRPTRAEDVRFWHGDLFFGNMFYDFTARRVMAIDPRGQLDAGEIALYGDQRYDLAKLAHSIVGQYDKIVLDRSTLVENGPLDWTLTVDARPEQAAIEEIFTSFAAESCGIDPAELLAMTALLFLSMLPLHRDRPDLQKHFLATGLRLSARALAGTEPEAPPA